MSFYRYVSCTIMIDVEILYGVQFRSSDISVYSLFMSDNNLCKFVYWP